MFPAQAPRVSVLGSVPNPIDPSSDAGFVRVRSEAGAELASRVAVNKLDKVMRSQNREFNPLEISVSYTHLTLPTKRIV